MAIRLNGVVQLLQKLEAVARQEIETADTALLQALVGIESLSQGLRMATDELAFLCSRRAPPGNGDAPVDIQFSNEQFPRRRPACGQASRTSL